MAGRTPQQAVKNFLQPIRQALSCVTDVRLSRSGEAPNTDHVLMLADGDAVVLPCTRGGPLAIRVTQHYRVVPAEGQCGPWKVRTTGYYYTVETDAAEILSYQWHPRGKSPVVYPHLHLSAGANVGHAGLAEAYLPTGRVPLEQFLWLLIDDFHVRPRLEAGDWKALLIRLRKKFEQWRTWE